MEVSKSSQLHFILVHGLCHGAWCWYRLATLLQAAGHRATAVDLAACGAHPQRLDEVRSFADYSAPLLEAVSAVVPGGSAILVAHSFGGLSAALAAERFPETVAAVVFVTAVMPSTAGVPLSRVNEEFSRSHPPENYMDSEMTVVQEEEHGAQGAPRVFIKFGPNYLAKMMYQLSPPEDLTLAMMLVRPGSLFGNDPERNRLQVTEGRYGSVRRVFVVCGEDKAMTVDFQRWMVEQDGAGAAEVREMPNADHMAMLSQPHELCAVLLEIAGHCRQ